MNEHRGVEPAHAPRWVVAGRAWKINLRDMNRPVRLVVPHVDVAYAARFTFFIISYSALVTCKPVFIVFDFEL